MTRTTYEMLRRKEAVALIKESDLEATVSTNSGLSLNIPSNVSLGLHLRLHCTLPPNPTLLIQWQILYKCVPL